MTVCVAAICQEDIIIGASDRMVTSGDVQFEPLQTKVWRVTSSIVIMISGDTAMQSAILQKVTDETLLLDSSAAPILVSEVADMYGRYYNEEIIKRTDQAILARYGLNNETFLTRQNELSPDFVRLLSTEIMHYKPPEADAIIAGVDLSGAHLYLVIDGSVTCEDASGFVSIGAGYAHANSQFMFAGHTKFRPFAETLLLTFTAKKRAEVAPGVGKNTDMFFIGPQVGTYLPMDEIIHDGLLAIYRRVRNKEERVITFAETEVKKYVRQITENQTRARQKALAENSGGNTSTDEAGFRDGSEAGEPEDDDDWGDDAPDDMP